MSEHEHHHDHEHHDHDHEEHFHFHNEVPHSHGSAEHAHTSLDSTSASVYSQVKALLDYNYKHNTSHADELDKLADKLESLGYAEAAAKVSAAKELFSEGNKNLKEALELIG